MSTYYTIISQRNGLFYKREYYLTDTLKMKGSYSSLAPISREGRFTYYFENGQIESIGEYIDNKKDGEYICYYSSGKIDYRGAYIKGKEVGEFLYYYNDTTHEIRRKENYSIGELKEGYCYTQEGKDTTYFPYQEMPQFFGGEKALQNYLSKELYYPSAARENGIEGRAIVKFTVLADGTIDSIEVIESVCPSIDKVSIEVVKKMPPWKPGKHEGKPVNVWYTLPFMFKLE